MAWLLVRGGREGVCDHKHEKCEKKNKCEKRGGNVWGKSVWVLLSGSHVVLAAKPTLCKKPTQPYFHVWGLVFS